MWTVDEWYTQTSINNHSKLLCSTSITAKSYETGGYAQTKPLHWKYDQHRVDQAVSPASSCLVLPSPCPWYETELSGQASMGVGQEMPQTTAWMHERSHSECTCPCSVISESTSLLLSYKRQTRPNTYYTVLPVLHYHWCYFCTSACYIFHIVMYHPLDFCMRLHVMQCTFLL